MAAISIRGVEKNYGKTAVMQGIDLEIGSREFVVILGPSGCGKSTLLRMIAGLESITDGDIAISGRVVNELEPRERGCAMVFQNYALYPHMSVADNIGYSLKVAGVPKTERRERVGHVARSVGLENFLDRRPAALSGGQRQRVAMARAMIREPKVFLFDEPLSNLDAQLRVQMRAEIRRLHKQLGTTSVFVTHDQAEAMTLADRLVVMRAGRIEQQGTPSEVYSRPASRFVAAFIGSPPMNLVEGCIDNDGAFVPHGATDARLPLARPDLAARHVHLGFRPETLHRAGDGGSFAAEVEFIEELGASRVVHLRWAGQLLTMLQTEPTDLQPGHVTRLQITPDAVHLFDDEDGRRLDEPVHRAVPEPALAVG